MRFAQLSARGSRPASRTAVRHCCRDAVVRWTTGGAGELRALGLETGTPSGGGSLKRSRWRNLAKVVSRSYVSGILGRAYHCSPALSCGVEQPQRQVFGEAAAHDHFVRGRVSHRAYHGASLGDQDLGAGPGPERRRVKIQRAAPGQHLRARRTQRPLPRAPAPMNKESRSDGRSGTTKVAHPGRCLLMETACAWQMPENIPAVVTMVGLAWICAKGGAAWWPQAPTRRGARVP